MLPEHGWWGREGALGWGWGIRGVEVEDKEEAAGRANAELEIQKMKKNDALQGGV